MSDTAQSTSEAPVGTDCSAPADAIASPISIKRIVWPLLLSLVVLAVIGIYTFEPTEFRRIVDDLNPWWMTAALGTLAARVYLGGWRLDLISRGRLGRMGGIRGQLAWDFFSNVTPSAVGGAPFAALYVARDQRIDVGESTAFMLFSILLDQLGFALTIPAILIASVYLDVIPASLGDVGAAAFVIYFLGLLAWIVLFGYATLVRPEHLHRFTSWIFRFRWLRRFRARVEREMLQLRHRAEILRSEPPTFYLQGLLLTIGIWLSRYLLVLFVIGSFLDEFDKTLTVIRTVAMTLGSLVLPTPGGAGGLEGLYALFIGPLIPAATLAPTLLVWRFLGYYLFIGIGVFLSAHHVQKTIRRNNAAAAPSRDGSGTQAENLHEQLH